MTPANCASWCITHRWSTPASEPVACLCALSAPRVHPLEASARSASHCLAVQPAHPLSCRVLFGLRLSLLGDARGPLSARIAKATPRAMREWAVQLKDKLQSVVCATRSALACAWSMSTQYGSPQDRWQGPSSVCGGCGAVIAPQLVEWIAKLRQTCPLSHP